jgi:hypothetical protein
MTTHNQTADLKFTETKLVLYPSVGIAQEDGTWKIHVAGFAFQDREINLRRKLLLKVLQRAMKVDPNELATELFRERIQPFMASGEKGQRIEIRVGHKRFQLRKKTKRNGHFRSSFLLTQKDVSRLEAKGVINGDLLKLTGNITGSDLDDCSGTVVLLQNRGLSIISDVDDTIKITEVGDMQRLLKNTFLREFESIVGMADVYQSWADYGAQFHYVSSSPWQLFEPLVKLKIESGFPAGSIHLRDIGLRHQIVNRVRTIQRRGKGAVIRFLLKSMPNRKFFLIGDSSEKDPEIYRKICVRYPQQVTGLFIRQVSRRPVDAERLEKITKSVPHIPMSIFRDAEELAENGRSLIADFAGTP